MLCTSDTGYGGSPSVTLEMWITLAILVVALVLFVTEWLRIDVVALLVVLALMLTGILEPAQAISGFSSTIVVLIISLFIVGGAVFRTGLASMISDQILRLAGTSETRLLVVVMITVAVMSAFISNTGTVALLLPAVVTLAASTRISLSKMLIPLAFSSSLGGAMTLIGTPPNLVVSDVLAAEGFEPFSFFSFLPVGAVLVVVGVIFFLYLGKYILPDYKNETFSETDIDQELLEAYRLSESIFRVRIRSSSPLKGKTVADTDFSHRYNINILEILRPSPARKLATIANQDIVLQPKHSPIHPRGETVLEQDDVMIVRGDEHAITEVSRRYNLAIQPRGKHEEEALISQEVGIAEVVVTPESSFIGKTVEDLRFGSVYNLTVLRMRRAGASENMHVTETPLQFGDVLLVQGTYENIAALDKRARRDLVLISPEAIQTRVFNRNKAPLAFLILLLMLVLLVTQVVQPVVATMLASVLAVLAGCLTIDEAYDSIDWKSVILIGGMIPLSDALIEVGLVEVITNGITYVLGDAGPIGIQAGMFILTVVLTQVLSNTATSVLLAPIAIAVATTLGVSPRPMMMAIAVAASMAFATPMASPVNTLVMSAGSYHFRDYAKVGIPLIGVMFVISMILIPLVFPF